MNLDHPQRALTIHDTTMHMAAHDAFGSGKEHAQDEFPLEVASASFNARPASSSTPGVSLGITPACLPPLQGIPVGDIPSGAPLGSHVSCQLHVPREIIADQPISGTHSLSQKESVPDFDIFPDSDEVGTDRFADRQILTSRQSSSTIPFSSTSTAIGLMRTWLCLL